MPPDPGAPPQPADEALDRLELGFLRMSEALGLLCFGMLFLAQIGWLGLAALGVLVVGWGVGHLVHARVWRRGSAIAPDDALTAARTTKRPAFLALVALVILSAILFTPPFETTLWAGDAAVYTAVGARIATSGALLTDDSLVGTMPLDVRRALFHNRVQRDRTGEYARFPGGVSIPDIERARTAPGFAPLYPLWLALFGRLFGAAGGFWVGPVFGILGVSALFFLGRAIGDSITGLIAGLLLALSLPQIWFSRFPSAEIVAQFFLLAGLLMLVRCLDGAAAADDDGDGDGAASTGAGAASTGAGDQRLAAGAGVLLGASLLTRLDLLPIALVALALFAAASLRIHGDCGLPAAFRISFAGALAYGALHFTLFPSNYGYYIPGRLRELPLGDHLLDGWGAVNPGARWALLAGLGGSAWLIGRLLARRSVRGSTARWLAMLLLAGSALYAAAWAASTRAHWLETVPGLAAYVSWPVLVVFLVSLAVVSWRACRLRRSGFALLLLFVVLALLQNLHNPHESMTHIRMMRRFVPVVLPGMFLLIAAGLTTVGRTRAARLLPAILLTPLILLAVAAPSRPLAGEQFWPDGLAATRRLAAQFPSDSVLIIGPELAGIQLPVTLAYQHRRDAIALQDRYPDAALLQQQVLEWLDSGRDVHLLVSRRNVHFQAPLLDLLEPVTSVIGVRTLEETALAPPRRGVSRELDMLALRFARRESSPRSIDVGAYASDALFELRGFHDPEASAATGRDFRWTTGEASVEVPAVERIVLVVEGGRPVGVAPAELSVWIADRLQFRGRLGTEPQRVVVENPFFGSRDSVRISLRPNVFVPKAEGLSEDSRELGVRLYAIELGSPAADIGDASASGHRAGSATIGAPFD